MKIHTQPDQMGGVWANAAAVRHSPHEFTIDFLRCDFDDSGKAAAGILVQRVNMSPLFVTQLIAALQDNWSKYADKSMPKDLLDDMSIESPRLDDVGEASLATNAPSPSRSSASSPPNATISSRRNRPVVSVPVLSTQSTSMRANPSTA